MADFTSELAVSIDPDNDAYTDGDTIGGLLTFGTLISTGSILRHLTLTDQAGQGSAVDLWLFDAAPTTFADDAAFAPVYADLTKLVAKVAIASADYSTENSMKWVAKTGLDVTLVKPVLYGYLVANGSTPNYGADKLLNIRLFLEE
jgi:hypothetical protein